MAAKESRRLRARKPSSLVRPLATALSHSQGDRVRTDALRATDRARLLIASATPAAAHPRHLWREKHNMLNLLVGGRSGSAGLAARCRAIAIEAATTTKLTCSAIDATSCMAPNRRCGGRGVQGASGSR